MTPSTLKLTIVATLVALLGAGGAASGQAGPATHVDIPELAISRGHDVYALHQDSTLPRRLTTHRAVDSQPAWSPDGNSLAFVSYRDGDAEIYVADPNGRNLRRLTRNRVEDALPAWSPDGRRIAFASNRTGGYEIHVISATGAGSARRITHGATRAYGSYWPAWSPDGRLIAFASTARTPENAEIYVMRPNGSGLRRLTRTKGDSETLGDDSAPAWAPDGKSIAFTSNRAGQGDIWIMRPDGTGQRRLAGRRLRDEDRAAFSPDGRTVAFESRGSDGGTYVYFTRNTGRGLWLLTRRGAAPSWRPTPQRTP